MLDSSTISWLVSIGLTSLLYFFSLFTLFSFLRARRHLQERWEQFQGTNIRSWDKKASTQQLRSIQTTSKLKSILAQPYPYFKVIEYLFYRSNAFSHIKMHIAGLSLSVVVMTELTYLTIRFSLVNSFFLGLFISLILYFFILHIKENQWKKTFMKVFPLSLDIINRGLKSGMTLGRGIAMVSEEVEEPVGSEFSYIASQLQIGLSPDDALAEASIRIGVDEFRFFSLALVIQREMGGSLADVIGKLSEVIRERDRFRKKVWALSSEGRITAYIVGILPVFLGIMVELINPGYIRFFFTDPKGQIMLWVCGGLTLTGFIVIMQMMKVGK